VWCSPVFEADAVSRYAPGAGQPPSCDPATIYRSLLAAVTRPDPNNSDIQRQKTKLSAVALDLANRGTILMDAAQEAVAYLEATHVTDWKPLIYAIPYAGVEDRVLAVPRAERVSAEMEYVITDLRPAEFDVIEPMPC
jgi:hypothetical protein